MRLAALAFVFVATVARAELSDTEKRIVERVVARSDAAIEFLERTVRVNSGTMNAEGVREVGDLFAKELAPLGFETRWSEMPASMQRAGHLVATRTGTKGKRVLLIGHLDTVFEKQSPVQPWDRQGKRVRGQGVVDMKGGDVAIVEALRALHGLGLLDGTTITVYLGGDEERSGSPLAVSRRDLVEAAKASDVALGFEGIRRMRNGEDMAVVGRRGSSSIRLEVTAQPGHSSAVFSPGGAGLGAIYEGARVLNTIREQVAEPGLSFNPGVALGGTNAELDIVQSSGSAFGKNNVISRQFVTHLDLRFVDPVQEERARQKIREIAGQSLRGTRSVVKFASGYPSMVATPGNQALLSAYSRASEDAGYGAVHAGSTLEGGASDASHVSPFVDVIDGLGPWGGGAHSVNEWLDIPSVERATVRAAILIYRLTRAP